MSAVDNLGAHLLGRKYVRDARDWPLSKFLVDPLDPALAAFVGVRKIPQEAKDLATLLVDRVKQLAPTPPGPPSPSPTPQPTPVPAGDVVWQDSDVDLDQGQTPHCVGFGWAQWGNTLPVDDRYANSDGDAVYYEAKAIDGEPGQEDGSSVRSGAQAMQNRKRLANYAFAANIDEVVAWITAHGPVVFGTDWTQDMFTPDPSGYVKPTGAVAGGHCYVCVGYHPAADTLEFLNSWGASWGNGGHFLMQKADVVSLFANQGEACAAVELP